MNQPNVRTQSRGVRKMVCMYSENCAKCNLQLSLWTAKSSAYFRVPHGSVLSDVCEIGTDC